MPAPQGGGHSQTFLCTHLPREKPPQRCHGVRLATLPAPQADGKRTCGHGGNLAERWDPHPAWPRGPQTPREGNTCLPVPH